VLPTIKIYIGSIVSRRNYLADLLKQIPNAIVCVDVPLSGGSWRTRRTQKLHGADSGCDWIIMLDDDVIVCDNFEYEAARCLSYCPGDIASLFIGRKNELVKRVKNGGYCWLESTNHVYGAATCLKSKLAKHMVCWDDKYVSVWNKSGDLHVSLYAAANHIKTYCSIPSLAEHRPDAHSTLFNGSNKDFMSSWFVKDASKIEWNSKSVFYGKSAVGFLRSAVMTGQFKGPKERKK
jgi:hypothetical protein